MAGEQARQRERTHEPKLEAVVAQARRVAASVRDCVRPQERDNVGPRELFIAAAMKSPQVVAEAARRGGIHLRRLVGALEEWPIKEVAPAQTVGVTLTPTAQALLDEAARGPEERACRSLVERLLDPAALPPAANAAEGEEPEPDATAKVLSRLGLI